ncbi:MAG: acyl-CoA thioester hydrolase/BAAT C-terminal domain-containing protein [Aggregatilineales bacterium]
MRAALLSIVMTSAEFSERSLRQRALFVIRTFTLIMAALLLGAPFLLGFLFMLGLTAPGCRGETSPARFNLPFEEVSFPSSEFGRPVPAYFIPGAGERARAAVIIVPTLHAPRGDRMAEILVYHRAGYSVLTYSSRGCVGPVANSLGYRDASAIGDAVSYLRQRPEIDTARIGAHGFSAGGAAALMGAARFPDLAAVVSMGGYHDFGVYIENDMRQLGLAGDLLQAGAFAAYRLMTGDPIAVLSPITVIDQIAPRPILLIYGAGEPSRYAGELMAAAGAHADLWLVPGAGHGDYVAAAPEAFAERITAFFDEAFGFAR